MNKWNNKHVLIIGASGGIGDALANQFSRLITSGQLYLSSRKRPSIKKKMLFTLPLI